MLSRTSTRTLMLLVGTAVAIFFWVHDTVRPSPFVARPTTYPFAETTQRAQAQIARIRAATDPPTPNQPITLSPPIMVYSCDALTLAIADPHTQHIRSLLPPDPFLYYLVRVDSHPTQALTVVYRDQQWAAEGWLPIANGDTFDQLDRLLQQRATDMPELRADLMFCSEPNSMLGSSTFALIEDHGQSRVFPLIREGPFFTQLAPSSDTGYPLTTILPLMREAAQAALWERARDPTTIAPRLLISFLVTAIILSCLFFVRWCFQMWRDRQT